MGCVLKKKKNKKQNRKVIITPCACWSGFQTTKFQTKTCTYKKKNSDCIGTNPTGIMEHGISGPKLLGFNWKQHKTHAWQVSAQKELLKMNI